MTTFERLTEDMKTSMRSGDSFRTGVLRLVRGAVKNEEIKSGATLDDAGVTRVLQREAKQRRDSIEAYKSAGRQDLADHEEAELKVVREYLPETMGQAELEKVVDDVIAQTGASDMKQMGMVIGKVMSAVGARADGGAVSKLVRERLA